jgi:hypothetical protein
MFHFLLYIYTTLVLASGILTKPLADDAGERSMSQPSGLLWSYTHNPNQKFSDAASSKRTRAGDGF